MCETLYIGESEIHSDYPQVFKVIPSGVQGHWLTAMDLDVFPIAIYKERLGLECDPMGIRVLLSW